VAGKSATWTVETPCAVVDNDDLDETGSHPLVVRHNLERALSVSQVQDIAANLAAQGAEGTERELLRALVFYVKNDAFVEYPFGG